MPDVSANEHGFQNSLSKRSKAELEGKRYRTIDDIAGDFKQNYGDNNNKKVGASDKEPKSKVPSRLLT